MAKAKEINDRYGPVLARMDGLKYTTNGLPPALNEAHGALSAIDKEFQNTLYVDSDSGDNITEYVTEKMSEISSAVDNWQKECSQLVEEVFSKIEDQL